MFDIPRASLCRVQCLLMPSTLSPLVVRTLRKNSGLNQQQFADAIGFSVSYVRKIERRRRKLTPATSAAIRTYFERAS